jgi:hypothetical protein
VPQTIPFALFEDLQESIFLMEYANGVRPYILEWYYDVFLKAYQEKDCPDSKITIKGTGQNEYEITTCEKRIALTTQQLVENIRKILYKEADSRYLHISSGQPGLYR